MNKKIFLFIVFAFMMAAIPGAKVFAIHTYVGVQVTAASAPGCVPGTSQCGTSYSGASTDNNYCLPVSTQLTIGHGCTVGGSGSTCSGFTAETAVAGSGSQNPPTGGTASPSCANGNTLWSGLVDLAASTNYTMQLTAPSFCPGILYGNFCWVTAGANKSCSATCGNYGLTAIASGSECDTEILTCSVIQSLKGSPCATCNPVSGTNYDYYDASTSGPTANYCYYTNQSSYSQDCNALGANLVRACDCDFPSGGSNNFYFPFTTPSSF